MKINNRPPSLPSVSVDTTKTPAAPAPLPVPYPNVGGQASTFQPRGDERRYSVRFLNGIGPRLAIAGLSGEHAEALTRRFGTMSRSALDREGRVVDTILASTHPRQGMALYEGLARLGSAVTKGGFKVEPNHEKTWTVTPPAGDPFVFGAKGQKRLELADGTALELGKAGHLRVGEQELSRDTAERAARVSAQALLSSLSIIPTVGPALGAALGMGLTALDALQQKEPVLAEVLVFVFQESIQASNEDKKDFAGKLKTYNTLSETVKDQLAAVAPTLSGLGALLSGPSAQNKGLQSLLDRAGHSAAPSRTNDPDAERAVLLAAMGSRLGALLGPGRDKALKELGTFADALRGRSQADARETLGHLLRNASADGKLTVAEHRHLEDASRNAGRLGGELQRLKAQDARTDASADRFRFKP